MVGMAARPNMNETPPAPRHETQTQSAIVDALKAAVAAHVPGCTYTLHGATIATNPSKGQVQARFPSAALDGLADALCDAGFDNVRACVS